MLVCSHGCSRISWHLVWLRLARLFRLGRECRFLVFRRVDLAAVGGCRVGAVRGCQPFDGLASVEYGQCSMYGHRVRTRAKVLSEIVAGG